jgi:hypothetical protein
MNDDPNKGLCQIVPTELGRQMWPHYIRHRFCEMDQRVVCADVASGNLTKENVMNDYDEMGRISLHVVRAEAERELIEERRRELVEQEKQRLRTARPWWAKFFPWVIKIERRRS